jgi:hypothetical protein
MEIFFKYFLENVSGALPQALEIIFGVQMKRSNEKIVRRKLSSQKVFFFSIWTPSYFLTLLFLLHFK